MSQAKKLRFVALLWLTPKHVGTLFCEATTWKHWIFQLFKYIKFIVQTSMQEQQFIFTHLYHGKYVFLAAYIVPLETVVSIHIVFWEHLILQQSLKQDCSIYLQYVLVKWHPLYPILRNNVLLQYCGSHICTHYFMWSHHANYSIDVDEVQLLLYSPYKFKMINTILIIQIWLMSL